MRVNIATINRLNELKAVTAAADMAFSAVNTAHISALHAGLRITAELLTVAQATAKAAHTAFRAEYKLALESTGDDDDAAENLHKLVFGEN